MCRTSSRPIHIINGYTAWESQIAGKRLGTLCLVDREKKSASVHDAFSIHKLLIL